MDHREFIKKTTGSNLGRVDQAIALLWFYRYNQTFEERSVSELASDLQDAGVGKPNVTTLKEGLQKSRITVRGRRPNTFQVNVKHLDELNRRYEPLLTNKLVTITESVLSADAIKGTRRYIERLVDQINGCYDYEFYDGCAVLLRRLIESLIIESFIASKDAEHIKSGGRFMGMEALIERAAGYGNFNLSSGAPKAMKRIKELGDIAAHDRTYVTTKIDIDDLKVAARRLFQELIVLSEIV